NSGVTGATIKNIQSGAVQDLAVFGVFVFVGYDVNTQILKQPDGSMLCECDEWNSIKVDLSMKTSVPGLFAAGDVRVQAPKQVVCAAGDGATAALQAIAYLEHH
ncbi:NAD(P)/FAD-dependent oxidoreductase, partial [Helicobacter equorum]|uniref:NAD(P)/FAD-dependent oxidoreductase n=1 Tax=Helicobacter equorum TaxID=361872 RepID=UPI00131587F5